MSARLGVFSGRVPVSAACEQCGQECLPDDAWTVRGFCAACRGAAYGAGVVHASAPLFDDGPVPMRGQTEMEGIE